MLPQVQPRLAGHDTSTGYHCRPTCYPLDDAYRHHLTLTETVTAGSVSMLWSLAGVTMTENVEACQRLVSCCSLPIMADAEAGFGGPLNAFELMKSMIEAGAAGVHFEDQLASEKKCGHMGGKVLVPTQQFVRTLVAAARADPDAERDGLDRCHAVAGDAEAVVEGRNLDARIRFAGDHVQCDGIRYLLCPSRVWART